MGACTRLCFLLFCVFLASVSSVKKLNNIDDLRKTGYGRPRPRHGLQLLFWLAQNAIVDQNNHIQLNFNPRMDYGSHWFGNREDILPPLSSGQSYYSVGNLNYPHASMLALPEYVRGLYRNSNLPERNMDRLIISLDQNRPNSISNVFITAHNRNRNDFNRSETYKIDPALILMIRETNCQDYVTQRRPQRDNEDDDDDDRCNQFLEQTGYNNYYCRPKHSRRKKRSPYSQCNTYDGIKLEIKTTTQGYSKLIWENIPADIMKNHIYVYIDICQNTPSSDPNEDPTQVRKTYFNIDTSSGALDTSVSLNAGLQPRLRLYTSNLNYVLNKPYIWNGLEFNGANRVIPIRIKGIDASLQLYAGYGKACARLYIKKTFNKDVLYYSWVGFYKSSQDKNDGYYTYQYAVDFPMIDNTTIKNYDIYQYDSSLTISPGVQIRFLLDKEYNKVLAQTTPWESDEKVTSVCDKGKPELSSSWSYPEFFYEPELYDANNVIPIRIQMYDAGLQLFTQDGKACARLYIRKTFTDWKNTFYYSWVGFYKNKAYETYQYTVYFEKMEDTKHFDVYQYKSELAIEPGVQIRFMKDKGYDKKLAETEPWKSG